jgi:hypothetical protein
MAWLKYGFGQGFPRSLWATSLRSAYAKRYSEEILKTKSNKGATKRVVQAENAALQEAIRTAMIGPADPLAEVGRQMNAALNRL